MEGYRDKVTHIDPMVTNGRLTSLGKRVLQKIRDNQVTAEVVLSEEDNNGIKPAIEKEERKRLQAEIDAAAFHAYGLDRNETAFVLDDFHRVQNPRLMTDDYFELG